MGIGGYCTYPGDCFMIHRLLCSTPKTLITHVNSISIKKRKKKKIQSLPLSQNSVITDINVGLNHFAPCLLLVCVYFPPIITLFLSTCLEVRCCFL